MSLVKFAEEVRKILKKGDNATLPELQNVVLKDLGDAYNKLKEEKLTIKLKYNGENEYDLYPHDPLLMLKFKHRIKSKLIQEKDIDELNNAKIFMHLSDDKMIEVAEIYTFKQLIDKHGEPSYFSFEVVDEEMLGGRKKKRRKKKKAFPSRKKTHRKNSTKKRARK